MPGPLSGLKIVELAGIGPGPFAGMLLADMGADIVRVTRNEPGAENDPLLRGRRAVVADLKTDEGQQLVKDLASRADAVFEGFRPGVAERLGVGPDDLLAVNPRLVYGRMTGYGQTGPMAAVAGHDINYIAIAGVLGQFKRSGEKPLFPMNLVGDFGGGGMFLAFGIVCAVLEAQRTGKGQVVDAAMVDGASLLSSMIHGFRANGMWTETPGVNFLDSGAHFYETYETADGGFMAVGAIEPQFYTKLLELLEVSADDFPQWDQGRWPEFKTAFGEIFRTKSRDEWTAIFELVDACVTPVLTIDEAPSHHHMAARDAFAKRGGATVPAPAPRFSGSETGAGDYTQISAQDAAALWT